MEELATKPTYDRLTAEAVNKVIQYCTVPAEEFFRLLPNAPTTRNDVVSIEGAKLLRGVSGDVYIFSAEKLKECEADIQFLVAQLPDECKADVGYGSFLTCCTDTNQRQWGEHQDVDRLLALGRATSKVAWVPSSWDLDGQATDLPSIMTCTGRHAAPDPAVGHSTSWTTIVVLRTLLFPLVLVAIPLLLLTWPLRWLIRAITKRIVAKKAEARKSTSSTGEYVVGDSVGDDFKDIFVDAELYDYFYHRIPLWDTVASLW